MVLVLAAVAVASGEAEIAECLQLIKQCERGRYL